MRPSSSNGSRSQRTDPVRRCWLDPPTTPYQRHTSTPADDARMRLVSGTTSGTTTGADRFHEVVHRSGVDRCRDVPLDEARRPIVPRFCIPCRGDGMIGHLDIQAGLEHLARQRRQQTVVAGQLNAITAGTVNELGCPLAHRRLITHQRDTTRRPRSLGRRRSVRSLDICVRSHRSNPPAHNSRSWTIRSPGYTQNRTVLR